MVGHGRLIRLGLEKAKADGKRLGHPPGREAAKVFLGKYPDVIKAIQAGRGYSVRAMARMTGKAPGTVQRVCKVLREISKQGEGAGEVAVY